jgi:hypothetical protein
LTYLYNDIKSLKYIPSRVIVILFCALSKDQLEKKRIILSGAASSALGSGPPKNGAIISYKK